MKASELRIGNLVYVTDNLTNLIFKEITPINIHNLMHLTGWDKSPVDIEFEPIPLTEEFLLKFGFIYRGIYYHFPYNDIFKLEQHKLNNAYWLRHSSESLDCVRINYVHQLQNLYFALTGNELKYEEQS